MKEVLWWWVWLLWSCDHLYHLQIKSTHSLLGNDDEQRERSIGKLFNEVNIVKEQVLNVRLLLVLLIPLFLNSCSILTLSNIIRCSEKVSYVCVCVCACACVCVHACVAIITSA